MRSKRGFTLIELLVVCGIMIVVSAIILANNNQYGGQVLLQNLAYDVALSIRQAQVYGISVERFGTGGQTNFGYGYGIHFDSTLATQYELFADVGGTGMYTSGEVVGQPYTLGRNYTVAKLCAPAGADAASCNCALTNQASCSTLDILFVRPEPDAFIAVGGVQCYKALAPQCADSARIVLRSPRGDTMSVSVQANGQIAVDQKSVTAAP